MTVVWYYLYVNKQSIMTSAVGPEHFVASPLLGHIWEKAIELTVANQPVDLLAISRPHHAVYQAISDHMTVATPGTMQRTEKLVRDGAAVHYAMVGARDWLERAEQDEDATAEDLHSAFGEVATRFQVGEDIEADRFGAMTNAAIERFLEEDTDRGIPVPVISDEVRHYKFGKFYLVGGLTSNHKTTYGLQSVLRSAKSGYGTLIWTLEDDNLEVTERMMVSQSDHVTLDHFERGKQPGNGDGDAVYRDLIRLGTNNEKLPIYHLDKRMTLTKMIAQISRMVYKHGIRMVVIDFMQLIPRDDPRTQDTQHQTECAQALADLAKRLDIVVICIVQLTQDAARRAQDGDAPRLGDIRGGSAIAQAAYGAIMCHRPAPDKSLSSPPEGQQRLQLWVRKWKRATLGGIECFVDAAHDRITREPGTKPPPARKFYSTS